MQNNKTHAAEPAPAAANQHNPRTDELLMKRAGELAAGFCKYLESQNLICDGRVIMHANGEVVYDLSNPSAKFQAIFAWVTKVSLSLQLGQITLELVRMSGFATFDQAAFPERGSCSSCKLTAFDLLPPGTILTGGNA